MFLKFWNFIIELISSEWLLTRIKLSNGGSIIALRTLLTTLIIYLFILAVRNLIDPERTWTFSFYSLRIQILETFHWFGAIFVIVYTALYARFASQWAYLANLYNNIKSSEVRGTEDVEHLAAWKAGFMEDCEELHLATKSLFATVIYWWGSEEKVKRAFIDNTPGGEDRYLSLMKRISNSYQRIEKKHLSESDNNGQR